MTDDRPPKPEPLDVDPDGIPDYLQSGPKADDWLVWRFEWQADRDEWAKVPCDGAGAGHRIDATDPDNGVAFGTALETYESGDYDGLGIITDPDDLLVGLDFDDCRDPDQPHQSVPSVVGETIVRLDTYTEVSPSGTGYRVFALGVKPDGSNRADLDCDPVLEDTPHLEMYDGSGGRYLTVTGHVDEKLSADVERRPQELKEVHDELIAEEDGSENRETAVEATDGGVEAQPGGSNPEVGTDGTNLSDSELVEKAKNAENGEKFARLWRGSTSGYESHSEARQALANMLAFWTGGNRSRMLDLFLQSDLYRDEDDLRTFKNYEIPTALEGRTEFYDPDTASTAGDGRPALDEPARDETDVIKFRPATVKAWAGLGEDGEVGDLTDREKAAVVWDLIRASDEYHVRVRRDNGSLWAYDNGVWKPEGERTLRDAARRALGSMNYGANVLTELQAQARSDLRAEIEGDELGLAPGTIATENGLVYLEAAATGGESALRDLEPEDYALTELPVEYDPEAGYEEWQNYVEEWAEDGKADALQEYVGYCLHTGAMPIHRALLLVGSGANGKGTFLHVVRTLLGRENTSSVELQTLANEKDAVADFYGSLANIDDDLSSRKLGQGLGMFKKLVGGDRVRARRLYEDGFEFDATGKHLYAANEVPDVTVPDEDEAFWRRWLLVEFPNHYPPSERDPALRDRFTEPGALSGVLNWAIDGWQRLLEQGYFTGEERYAHAKRERWQAWGDSIDKFISECVERDPDVENMTTSQAHQCYAAWCREMGEKPASQQKLTTALKNEDVGYAQSVRVDGSVQRGYKALDLSDDVPDLEDTPDRDEPPSDEQNTSLDEHHGEDAGGSGDDLGQLAPAVEHWMRERDDGAGVNASTVYDHFIEDKGVPPDRLDRALTKLLQNGKIREPEDGTYRT